MSYHSPDETTQYLISVIGCDDETLFSMDLTKSEKQLIDRLITLCNNASKSVCMPTMCISDDVDDFVKEQNRKAIEDDD